MFEKEKIYWIKFIAHNGEFSLKGNVIEENLHLIKVKPTQGDTKIIAQSRITSVWEDK